MANLAKKTSLNTWFAREGWMMTVIPAGANFHLFFCAFLDEDGRRSLDDFGDTAPSEISEAIEVAEVSQMELIGDTYPDGVFYATTDATGAAGDEGDIWVQYSSIN